VGRTYAFVDESGNHDLDTSKSGSSGFFVICSVIGPEDDLPQAYCLRRLYSQSFSGSFYAVAGELLIVRLQCWH
jgi:hypothetical protein